MGATYDKIKIFKPYLGPMSYIRLYKMFFHTCYVGRPTYENACVETCVFSKTVFCDMEESEIVLRTDTDQKIKEGSSATMKRQSDSEEKPNEDSIRRSKRNTIRYLLKTHLSHIY